MFLHRNQGEKMKKITFLMIVATILFVGCSGKEEKESKELAAEAAVKTFDGTAEASTAVVDDTKEAVKAVEKEAAAADKESKELAAEAAVKTFDGAAEASTAIVDDIKEKTKQ
jgi:uncharacterized protein YcfL